MYKNINFQLSIVGIPHFLVNCIFTLAFRLLQKYILKKQLINNRKLTA